MAKQKKTRTTRTSGERRTTFSLNKFAFWVVIVIGIAMLASMSLNIFDWIFGWSWVHSVCSWVQSICFTLGMFVVVALSYRTARAKSTTWFVLWIILVVLVVFGLVSNLIGLVRL